MNQLKEDSVYSEFGKGFTYCIGLFLMHTERDLTFYEDTKDFSIWFNGAADHLYELEIPQNISNEFKDKINNFISSSVYFRTNNATKQDFENAIKIAKEILREWDIFNSISVIKAEWE